MAIQSPGNEYKDLNMADVSTDHYSAGEQGVDYIYQLFFALPKFFDITR